jgi:hypothetical protein
MPADVDRFEEKLEVEEEGGIKFMPFSLAGDLSLNTDPFFGHFFLYW